MKHVCGLCGKKDYGVVYRSFPICFQCLGELRRVAQVAERLLDEGKSGHFALPLSLFGAEGGK